MTNDDARGGGSRRGEHTRVAGHVRRGTSVEQPVIGARWGRLKREAGESFIERRWKSASRGMLGSQGLLRCSAGTGAEDAGRGRCVRQVVDGPSLHNAGPRVEPGGHLRAAGHVGWCVRLLATAAGSLLLALRGRSELPGLAEEGVDDPAAGALLEAPADLVEARRAVETAFCAQWRTRAPPGEGKTAPTGTSWAGATLRSSRCSWRTCRSAHSRG